MSVYQEELDRALARREGEYAAMSTELAARRILAAAGWNASGDELRAAAESTRTIKPERYDEVVTRAIEMQADETVRGRRVRPEEANMSNGKLSKFSRDPSIGSAKREEIREWLRERRRNAPDLRLAAAVTQVQERFGVVIREENFRVTYWRKSEPSENGKRPRPKPAPNANTERLPKPKRAGQLTEAPIPTPPATVSVTMHRTPSLAVETLVGGRARVTLDMELPFHEAMMLVSHVCCALSPAEEDPEVQA